VAADHHDLILERGIGARQLGDDVVTAGVGGEVAREDLDADDRRDVSARSLMRLL